MTRLTSRGARVVALLALVAILAACALPRSGPTKREIYAGSVQRNGDSFVVAVNDRVTRATAVTPALGFSADFTGAGLLGSDIINAGDTLSLRIFENVDQGLLAPQGVRQAALTDVQVDGSGNIFVPYAGKIRAAGNSTDTVRRIITEKLAGQTPDPQVQVVRAAGDGSTVSVTGSVGAQGVFAIERPTRTLTAMLARAGGLTIPAEVAQVSVIRGGRTAKVWFQDLFKNPRYDIALRGGDRILVQEDQRAFTALGATGTQNRVQFQTQNLSAIEAIAQVGGLSSAVADPTGVFVFRNEPEEIARQVLGRNDIVGDQRMIYVLDLTKPNGVFMARDFVIRDGDTVYVTEAPFVQWAKVLNAATGTLTTANTLTTAAQGK